VRREFKLVRELSSTADEKPDDSLALSLPPSTSLSMLSLHTGGSIYEDRHHVFYVYESETGELMRAGPVTNALRLLLGLSPTDILEVPRNQLERIRRGPMPPIQQFFGADHKKDLAVNSTSGQLYLVESGALRAVPDISALAVRDITHASIIQGVAEVFLRMVTPGPPIPDIYRDNTLIRYARSKEVFLVYGGRRHSVPGVGTFYRHGWDFDQVIVISNEKDVNIIPVGEAVARR
jgi:hypothetical protein